ncbi:glycosyltransferase family 2 protein [Methylobacterium komagatae]|uniref:Glycosyltransferase family 2 protein n=1 Tax=Methylobacterium komagatae TaxID=374425 RepID=A0ABW2BLX3_9HYPH
MIKSDEKINIKIAAVTMAWNESLFLPLWINHYARHVGINNLYIIDNDSDDGSTSNLGGISKIRYPRGEFDDTARATFVSNIVNAIRPSYDAVIFTDCDEFLVPDPSYAKSIPEYIHKVQGQALGAIGLNLHHMLTEERPFDPHVPIFHQRRHVQFVSPMCKPSITRDNVTYSPGFHNSSLFPTFGSLYNFHLRWVDCGYSLRRLDMTRTMRWKDSSSWHYQRQSDEDTIAHFLHVKKLNRTNDDDFLFADPMGKISSELRSKAASGVFYIPQNLRDSHLTVLPSRFDGSIL